MYGMKLILILIIIGGLIAYLGDKIGMKVGKKRLTIFNLRPKHTSTLITLLSGVLITTLTIIFLVLASNNVKLALFEMDNLLAEKEELSQKVTNKELQLNNLSYNFSLFSGGENRNYLALDNQLYQAGEAIASQMISLEDDVKAELNHLVYTVYRELAEAGIIEEAIDYNREELAEVIAKIKEDKQSYLVTLSSQEDIYHGKQVELSFSLYQVF